MTEMAPASDNSYSSKIEDVLTRLDSFNGVKHNSSLPVNKTVDHTLLKLDATPEQIDTLCDEARQYDFASVCVRPAFVAQSVKKLSGTAVKVASVIGFHEGTYDAAHKLSEVKNSLDAGAAELDVVINWPALKAQHYDAVVDELKRIRQAAPSPITLKLIFETSQLSDNEIVAACVLASAADFDFVKTSTGFLGHGAKIEHVRLMSKCADVLHAAGARKMLVKASGGVRSLQDAETMLNAGASRLGTSAGVAIAIQVTSATRQNSTEQSSSGY